MPSRRAPSAAVVSRRRDGVRPRGDDTKDGVVVILISCPIGDAERIARHLLDARLAACVNIVAKVRSLYWWKGDLEDAEESLLLVKTRTVLLEELERKVMEVHPYEVPEIIAIPIAKVNPDYLDWMMAQTKGPSIG